jgi:hypothetical protein
MTPAGRSVVSNVLAFAVAGFLSSAVCAASVEVYPALPGDAYQSHLYQVEVLDGSSWLPAYVYAFSRQSVTYWHTLLFPSVNFLTFGTTGQVDVRVTRIGGSITSIDVSPHSKNIPVRLLGGKAVLTVNPLNKVWITINGDDANPLFIFADPPKPPVPAGATYVGPGMHRVPGDGHYEPTNGEIIYLDGGAFVQGNLDVTGTRDVQLMGPGVLSGDIWASEGLLGLPFDQWTKFAMITGDWFGGNGATVSGITIVASPGYNFFGGATHASNVKILSPWFYSTDGFQGVAHVDQSFIFNGDNAFAPGAAGVQNDNVTITRCFGGTTENSVFSGGYYGFEAKKGYSALVDDVDIKTYLGDAGGPPLLASVFQVFVDNSDPKAGYSNQTYQNIRIEGSVSTPLLELKNTVYPWGGQYAVDPPLGNGYNFVFKNISLEGTQKYRSEIKGWDGSNGFHGVVLENVSFGGTVVTQSNLAQYFDVNDYVWGVSFDASPATPTVNSVRATSGPAAGGAAVTITGTGFVPGAAVKIGGVPATSVVVGGATTLDCKTPALPAGTLNDVVVTTPALSSGTLAKGWFADFADVPQTYLYHPAIEKIVRAGITTGCGSGGFCPDAAVTRDAMAKFLLVASHGAGFSPPAATGTAFCDVSVTTLLAKWIEELKSEGIASGAETGACGQPNFHPTDAVTRDAMAKFLGLAAHGSLFSPAPATGLAFCDVTETAFLAKWMEQLERDGVTGGCGTGACGMPNYCPSGIVSRGEMAKFLSKAFELSLYDP